MDDQMLDNKQKYLRDNIPEDKYQSFGQFCIEYVGNQDIQSWTIEYIKDLVVKFKQLHHLNELQNKNNPQTFCQYQTADHHQAQNLSKQIANEYRNNLQPNHPERLSKRQTHKQRPNSTNKVYQIKQQPKRSALDFFDSIFQKIEKQQYSPNRINKQDPIIPNNPLPKQFFNSNQFWISHPNIKQQTGKKQKANDSQASIFSDFLSNETSLHNNKSLEESKVQIKLQNLDISRKSQPIQVDRIQDNFIKIVKVQSNEKPQIKQKKTNKNTYNQNSIIKQFFQDTVPCFKSTIRAALSNPELSISIQKHQIINRSFFVPDYVMYILKILPSNIQCKRNYQDFTKLRYTLGRVYPGIQLPYLEKNSWLSQTNAQFIKKQKVMLELFLADLISNKELRNSRILEDFLTLEDHKKIKRKFQQYDRMEQLTSIEELCLLQGKVDVKISQEQRIYQEKSQIFITTIDQILQRYKKLTQTLSYQQEALMITLTSLSELMKQSQQEVKKFNNNVSILQIQKLGQSFQTFNKIYKQKYSQTKFQNDILNIKILPFLKYQKQNLSSIRQLIYLSTQMSKSYFKRFQIQPINTTQPYKSQKLKHYKLGILSESKNMLVFKYQVGFINNKTCNQIQRFFQLMGNKFINKYKYISKKSLEKITQNAQFWTSFKTT